MKLLKTCLVISLFGLATASSAATYNFTQLGFADGASVSGSFTGSDANNNGLLEKSELSYFELSFSGNSLVSAFTLDLDSSNFNQFSYDLDGFIGNSGAQEVIDIFRGKYSYLGQYARGWQSDIQQTGHVFSSDSSGSVITVSVVPEPSSYALMLGGLGLVGYMAARRRKQL